MSLRVVDIETQSFAGYRVAPSKGHIKRSVDPALVKHSFADFYGEDAWYPASDAALGTPYILRDTRGLVLELNPFAYNPATGRPEDTVFQSPESRISPQIHY